MDRQTVNLLNEGNSDLIVEQHTGNVQDLCPWEIEVERQRQNDDLNRQLESLWKTDFAGSLVDNKACNSIEDRKALKIMETTLTMVHGHFQVALPWRYNPPYLPNNKVVASRRVFYLKKRLMKDESLRIKYRETMNNYISDGHAEKIPEEELNPDDRPVWYVPHHPVVHPLKPGKVRVVYDCAATYKGTSLNQQLMSGPDQTNQLLGVLIRFRQERIGLVADVEAMFHQVLVEPKDRDVLRFLWWPDADLSKELQEYRMVKHLFGATSSLSVANFCLRKTAELNSEEFDDVTIETVKRNMYVDDLLKSTNTTDKAIRLVQQLRELLQKGGFRLTKWFSNDKLVLATVPESERTKSMINLKGDRLPTENTLGLKWNSDEDAFVWTITEKMLQFTREKSITRRGMVSAIYSFFDPLGLIAPFVMKAKLLLQVLSRKQISWDDPLPGNELAQWTRWLQDIPKLQEVKISRCFIPLSFSEIKVVQLHLFSDASRVGYAAVAYLRLEEASGNVHIAFVMGKSRLAPLREISIPRLELTAAVLSVRLSTIIREELDMSIQKTYYWTDSMSVLKCINNQTKRSHTFESNRLTVIHSETDPSEWNYVNREDNPADDGSKGMRLNVMIQNDRWLAGPTFLKESESEWPRLQGIPSLNDEDPQVRKEIQIYTASLQSNGLDDLISFYSDWWKLKRAVDTDSMINALRRFICIRGCPELLRSDRGTNFVCGNKELNQAMEDWNQLKINEFCTQRKIEWIFNAPAASHMNGATERMIRSVRQILKAILKEQIVTDEVLLTVMAEVVNILNSRLLTRNSNDPFDEEPITPNHLLHLRPTTAIPPGLFGKEDMNSKRAWRQAQYLAGLFW
ncbi:uncharacterized protein LOC114533508 [Dendronephthya gigantea]|uniref:uncharacterized protein LOC114533508 n=1 Tax=Dendronephthya gigantea TaxID=151771 RepID=UPI00106AEBBC|nr:uncharacterized protein LOC114533508 [Dendronephthya gigantea]